MPNEIGYQDIASLLARQPGVAERWQKRVLSVPPPPSSSRPTVSAVRSAPPRRRARAIGSPASIAQARDITGSMPRNPVLQAPPRYQASDFPKVDRTLKGDRLVVAPPPAIEPETGRPDDAPATLEDPSTSNASVMGAKTAAAPSPKPSPLDPELQAALSAPPLPQYGRRLPNTTFRCRWKRSRSTI